MGMGGVAWGAHVVGREEGRPGWSNPASQWVVKRIGAEDPDNWGVSRELWFFKTPSAITLSARISLSWPETDQSPLEPGVGPASLGATWQDGADPGLQVSLYPCLPHFETSWHPLGWSLPDFLTNAQLKLGVGWGEDCV